MFPTKALNLDNITLVSTLNALLVTGAFMSSLFFNGIDLRFFALTFLLLLLWIIINTILIYRQGTQIGSLLIPVVITLFWLWLGIDIVFSQVVYLSTVNFWWVGVFPLAFLVYTFSYDKDTFWKYVFTFLVCVAVLLCIYALYQVIVLQEQPSGTFYNKNSLAALINLLIFPLLATALLSKTNKRLIAYITAIFIFILLLGLINSRGALLAFTLSLLVMLILIGTEKNRRRFLLLGFIIITALVTAHIALNNTPHTSSNGIVERITTLQDAQSAGQSRFVIWQPAWELFKQNAWTGIGLGTYFLTIPPYLHPDDHSAGYYVHNDYLQIALETGIPGLILFLAIIFSVFYRFITTLNVTHKKHPLRTMFISLFAAMLGISIHSFFTFNLYVMPTMLALGLFLGYFNYLADQLQGITLKHWQPSRLLRPVIYYFCAATVSLSLLSYMASIGVAYHYQHKGNLFAAKAQLEDAHHAFRLAQILAPNIDSAYFADADLLRKSALVVAQHRPEFSMGLLQEANELLEHAELLNPLRPHTPYIRGLVLEQLQHNKNAEIIDAYQTALIRNPRFLPARIALARYLLNLKKYDVADQLLQEGLSYSYRHVTSSYLELIELNHSSAVRRGNTEQARNLSALLKEYQQIYAAIQSNNVANKITNPY